MQCNDFAPSCLPSFILPCPLCGHRMAITSVEPAQIEHGIGPDDLEDITHCCVHCGTTVTRTVRPLSGDAHHRSLIPHILMSPPTAPASPHQRKNRHHPSRKRQHSPHSPPSTQRGRCTRERTSQSALPGSVRILCLRARKILISYLWKINAT
jgi:hypothetical protein